MINIKFSKGTWRRRVSIKECHPIRDHRNDKLQVFISIIKKNTNQVMIPLDCWVAGNSILNQLSEFQKRFIRGLDVLNSCFQKLRRELRHGGGKGGKDNKEKERRGRGRGERKRKEEKRETK